MAIRKIAAMGHPVLRKKASPIPVEDIRSEDTQRLILDMVETMYEYDGQGLAAPQVHESKQLAVILWNFDRGHEPSIRCLINPKITLLTEQQSSYWEGCLSIPGLRGLVSRSNKISVEAYDQNAKPLSFVAEGYAATVVQHECDHLDGVLYIDRIENIRDEFVFNREFSRYIASSDGTAEEGDLE